MDRDMGLCLWFPEGIPDCGVGGHFFSYMSCPREKHIGGNSCHWHTHDLAAMLLWVREHTAVPVELRIWDDEARYSRVVWLGGAQKERAAKVKRP